MTAGGRELVHLIDAATGELTLEGLSLEEALSLPEELDLSPHELNCARPLDSAPLPPGAGSPEAGSKPRQAIASVDVRVRVHRVYHGSVVDGPGRRSVLQVQGCPIRCPGCYVAETHDPAGGAELSVGEALRLLLDPAGEPRDGVTLLGGEPFAQPRALAAVLRELEALGIHRTVYTGYAFEALRRRPEPEVLEALVLTDLLIDGPYVRRLSVGAGEWRGSRNQRLIPLPGLWV
ncbi:MAG: radical SAM protein [Chloroflexota bacterium]|nr:radical SAM protein [Chloroflexota bacterium]